MARQGYLAVADWGPQRFGSVMAAAIASAQQTQMRGPLVPWDAAIFSQMERKIVKHVA